MAATVTNTIRKPDMSPWKYGDVIVGIVGAGFTAGGVQIRGVAETQTDATGAVSVANLSVNNTNEIYLWINPDASQVGFRITADGTYSLSQVAVPIEAAVGFIGVSQAQLTAAIAGLGGGGGGSSSLTVVGVVTS